MEIDAKKLFTFNPKQKKVIKFINIFLLLVVLPLSIYFYFDYTVNRPSQNYKEVNYNLKEGASLDSIAKDLKELGVINSENLFTLYVKIYRLYPKFKSGIYTFPSGASLKQVCEQLQSGSNGIAITFVEGRRLEEYGILASSKLPSFNFEKFIEKTKGLEGQLFPDTYFFYNSATEDDVIRVMRNNFDQKMDKIRKSENYKKTKLTDNEIYIVASLLEKESYRGEERRIIAGIIIRRLLRGEILGIDASNQYGIASQRACPVAKKNCPDLETAKNIKWWDPNITLKDLQQDSPYNLRKNAGLPPQPISSFSEESLQAVIENKDSPYNFYLHDRQGNIHYGVTLADHEANISRYLSN